jgi:hypothetical protein
LDRLAAGGVDPSTGVSLADGNTAGRGDWVITRTNNRQLPVGRGGDFVKNGDHWQVLAVRADHSLVVAHLRHHRRTVLPAAYVGESVELGYATTAHRAQGLTVDTTHAVVTEATSREALYVMATRARTATTLYAGCQALIDPALEHAPPAPRTPQQLLAQVLGAETAERSATETLRDVLDAPVRMPALVAGYRHARTAALTAVFALRVRAFLGTETADRLLADPVWPRIAAALAAGTEQGWRPAALLATAVADENGGRASLAPRLLAARLHTLTRADEHDPHEPARQGWPAWLEPPPPDTLVGPDAAPQLGQRADLIRARVAELGVQASAERPGWAAHLPHSVAVLGQVAAWREQQNLTDTDPARPLGPPPADPAWRAAYRRTAADLARRTRAHPAPTPPPAPAPAAAREPDRHLARTR